MIIVDVDVPMLGKRYDFQIDENLPLGEVKGEITEMICRKEQCMLKGDAGRLLMWNAQIGKRLMEDKTAWEMGLVTGSRLLLV